MKKRKPDDVKSSGFFFSSFTLSLFGGQQILFILQPFKQPLASSNLNS
jgi:hypothetical protein